MTKYGLIVDWAERWKPPVILCTCPSCGLSMERTPGSWSGHIDGKVRARMGCRPMSDRDPDCYRTWDLLGLIPE